ncbi:MAG: putative porin [Verrucomicrobiota bacterium]
METMNQKHLEKMLISGAGLLISASLINSAQGQSADALIDKLVEKGILNVKEANELREESDKGFTSAYSVKSGLPDWVTSMKFNGDLRLRYDGIYIHPNVADRNRMRYRLRFGFTAVIKDDFEVGLRLASGEKGSGLGAEGGGNPISSNDSFGDNASKKLLFLDLAYGKWTPINSKNWAVSLTAGKMENPFVLSDIVFDPDYTPEGLGEQLTYKFNEKHSLKFNAGQFVLDELSGSSRDPYLVGGQLRFDSIWSPKIQTSLGVSGLAISDPASLVNSAVPNQNRGNTRENTGTAAAPVFALVYDYYPIVADGTFIYTLESFPAYPGAFPLKLSVDYVYNPGAPNNNEAYQLGVYIGKAGKKGTWELSYRYKTLEGDAWYEELVDSDTGAFYQAAPVGGSSGYGAGTNLRGHTIRGQYSPFDSFTFGITYYMYDLINEFPTGSLSHANRIQVDAVWRF